MDVFRYRSTMIGAGTRCCICIDRVRNTAGISRHNSLPEISWRAHPSPPRLHFLRSHRAGIWRYLQLHDITATGMQVTCTGHTLFNSFCWVFETLVYVCACFHPPLQLGTVAKRVFVSSATATCSVVVSICSSSARARTCSSTH